PEHLLKRAAEILFENSGKFGGNMIRSKFRRLSRLCVSVSVATTFISVPAMAQDAVSAEEVGSTDIVVTARNRAENLQDVPLSIRAFGAEELERRNVRSLQEVASLTPGLTFNEFKVGSIAVPTIRGLAQTDVTSLSNNVPVFL